MILRSFTSGVKQYLIAKTQMFFFLNCILTYVYVYVFFVIRIYRLWNKPRNVKFVHRVCFTKWTNSSIFYEMDNCIKWMLHNIHKVSVQWYFSFQGNTYNKSRFHQTHIIFNQFFVVFFQQFSFMHRKTTNKIEKITL